MSDLLLNNLAQFYAKKRTEQFIKEYNSEENKELTQLGKRELIEMALFEAFITGNNLNRKSDE